MSPPAAIAQTADLVEECNLFAENVNRNQAILDAFEAEIAIFSESANQAETLEEITAAADQYVSAVDMVTSDLSTLADDLEALPLDDSELSSFRSDYVAVVLGFNAALDTVSAAMESIAASQTEAELSSNLEVFAQDAGDAVEQIQTLAVEESDIINGVNVYCGAE